MTVDYRQTITLEPGKRGGRPCIRGMRIAVADVLGWLAEGMTVGDILTEFPELTETDIRAALAFAADRERRTVIVPAARSSCSTRISATGFSQRRGVDGDSVAHG